MVQPWDYMHKPGESGMTVENYLSMTQGGDGTPSSSPNRLWAQPFFTGDLPLSIASLGIRVSATGTAQTYLAIYDVESERNVYPRNKILDLGVYTYGATGPQLKATPGLVLPAGKLFWVVSNTNGGSGQHKVAFSGQLLNAPVGVLGWLGFGTAQGAVMLNIAKPFTDSPVMPDVFPASATPVPPATFHLAAAPAVIVVPA